MPEDQDLRPYGAAVRLLHKPPCRLCGSERVEGHGSFCRNDGTRQRRYRCRSCGHTFNEGTGTPTHYLKKRHLWPQHAQAMVLALSVRKMGAVLGIHFTTAFRWRHRLLAPLQYRTQPTLAGTVSASTAFIPYSEKGKRGGIGPGAYGVRKTYGASSLMRPFRRFTYGKPTCVLGTSDGVRHVLRTTGSGRPDPDLLGQCLANILDPGAELWASGSVPFAEACRRQGIPHRDMWGQHREASPWKYLSEAESLCMELHIWRRRFHGVATKYLEHYLGWFRFTYRANRSQPPDSGQRMLTEASLFLPAAAA